MPDTLEQNQTIYPAKMSALRQLGVRLIDRGIPTDIQVGDPDDLRRARIILSFTLILIILALVTGFYITWILPESERPKILISLTIAAMATFTIPLIFKYFFSLALAANLVLVAGFVVTLVIYTLSGGITGPLLHWCALFPVMAALMGCRRSAWLWAGISVTTIVFFAMADAAGFKFVDAIEFSQLEGPELWLQRFINVFSWTMILLAAVLLFEDHKNLQTSQLAAKNIELRTQIEQRFQAEQRSQYLAHYDQLTGLPNRRLFLEQLSAAIDQAPRINRTIALLFLDLDRFKEVNDTHGHDQGDQLLKQVAERLHSCVRLSDRVSHGSVSGLGNIARLGGDEFTIMLMGIRKHRDAAVVAQRILDSLNRPFIVDGLEVLIGTSIGISVLSEENRGAEDLVRNADLAMYKAKSAGKHNFKFHEESMNTDIVLRNTMTDALRSALDANELKLHYQPIIDTKTHVITGVEGLVRWMPEGREPVPTETLIQIAEESGLIIQLGEWVINEACRQFRDWQGIRINPPRIAINVSTEQFKRVDVAELVAASLKKHNLEAKHLEIEITEGAMMADESRTLLALEKLCAMGVSISLDDFGTGFSSLSYVNRFPIDTLKVDRSFISCVEYEKGSRAIATAVIALAHQLNLKVVGEGVENGAQEKFLFDNDCHEMQGYFYSKPLSPEEISSILVRGKL
ncbi:putative bifunctional diguanylate cyclase/phosphodiesterase [Candidatus Marimicrobium litorale]|uniref:EAL domain-containing protein n=1 Tax=Candidatus Marimicrobium litorale TaxID=2518991 RepID=A0ABT3T8B1_9GAMM|nr:EAL domain-containing protein [Candidatus Marimicrobium litorale]MCX2978522.1 EAL domain-containing protein [Candidatus Marimicrobium litorale]